MEYILVTYYKRGETWEVYGHESLGCNKNIGSFKSKEELQSFIYSLNAEHPVMRGQGAKFDSIIKKLSEYSA